MIFGFYTLGCKVNQYETQAMEQQLLSLGHTLAPFYEECDAYIINTCSVTAVSDKKSRAVIRRCRREHPDAIIAVCGCYSQWDKNAAQRLGADVIGGSGNRVSFIEDVLSVLSSRRTLCRVDNALARRQFEILPPGGLEGRTRAMLKVQDGCVNFCTYCIIPYTRGPIRSAPVELAVEQAVALSRRGYREIVITGIEIASWGADLPGKPNLSLLLQAICNAVPQVRIRLGSLEPRIIAKDFCNVLKTLPNLCPQFHLSMQSGCDSVLARMKRKYNTARYYESVCLLREVFPDCAITTDMIVAFPGETEEEFAESLAFIRKCGFAAMHIFPYSRRPGTPADKMPGQHNNQTKESRSKQAIAVADELSAAFHKNMEGKTLSVLFEEQEGEYRTGHTPNYIKVYVPGSEDLQGKLVEVCIGKPFRDGVLATLPDSSK